MFEEVEFVCDPDGGEVKFVLSFPTNKPQVEIDATIIHLVGLDKFANKEVEEIFADEPSTLPSR